MKNLIKHLDGVRAAAAQLPQVAADALGGLVAKGEAQQRSPEGKRWRKVRVYRDNSTGRFDPRGHIHYVAMVRDHQALLAASHPAAKLTRYGTKHMASRAKVPDGDSLGWWLAPLLRALRAPLRKAGR